MSEERRAITQVYDEYAARHGAAYTTFRQTYELENPRPAEETISRDIVSLIIVLALSIVSIASIVVSGSRTITEFGGEGIGAVAFVMIEGGIMAYSFFIARRNANKERLKNTVRWAMAGLILTVVVGLGANADAVLRGHSVTIPEGVKIAINLIVALSAPALAFISSDVLAIELMATEIRRRDAAVEYDKHTREWQGDLNAAWGKQQRNWGAKIEISKPRSGQDGRTDSAPLLSALSAADGQADGQRHATGQDYSKRTDARTLVEAYIIANPDAIGMKVRDLATLIGVGKTTVSDVIKEIKARQ